MKKLTIVVPVITAAVLLTAALWMAIPSSVPSKKGLFYGNVTIGPICPVERENVQCTPTPETYRARKVIVFGPDAKTLIATVDIDNNGNYSAELAAGTYLIDINHAGIDRSSDVPRMIIIEPEKSVRLDIKIDTGIR